MEDLPFVDEHAVSTDALRGEVWAAVVGTLRRTLGGGSAVARVLGCEPATASDDFAGMVGDTLPGFRVISSAPGRSLTLEGRHRFSRYRLTFRLDDDRLTATTEAAFPGTLGRLYRTAVIGSTAHERITRRMLRQMRDQAAA